MKLNFSYPDSRSFSAKIHGFRNKSTRLFLKNLEAATGLHSTLYLFRKESKSKFIAFSFPGEFRVSSHPETRDLPSSSGDCVVIGVWDVKKQSSLTTA
jgi:hypothetical protein